MCETLGTEPLEEEIPLEFEDLPLELQSVMIVYRKLQDKYDSFNGIYLCKDISSIAEVFKICDVPDEDKGFVLDIIRIIDSHRAQMSASDKQQKSSKSPVRR